MKSTQENEGFTEKKVSHLLQGRHSGNEAFPTRPGGTKLFWVPFLTWVQVSGLRLGLTGRSRC